MDSVEFLVIGAGISGLAFANKIRELKAGTTVRVLEAADETGGYCKTIKQDGFVWDYSGHFFHFKRPEIEAWLRARMPGQDIRTVEKLSSIRYAGGAVDFPFQKHIHQLPQAEFIECLYDLYFREEQTSDAPAGSFLEMLYRRFGRGIANKFLVPYNEKLYACDLGTLDVDAMGRFFPHADLTDIIRNMRPGQVGNGGYNATFTYPAGGAIEYVRALEYDLPAGIVQTGVRVTSIDQLGKIAMTTNGPIKFEHVISSAPLPALLAAAGEPHDASLFTWNQVLVFNLGFDRKGPRGVHWMYFPDRSLPFYRVGWYDNILDGDRMSLYVEIGADRTKRWTDADIATERQGVLAGLAREGIIDGHRLVSSHHVVLDPAYVHITRASMAETARTRAALSARGIHSVGRYGGWTYCSIEDNIIETWELATRLAQ